MKFKAEPNLFVKFCNPYVKRVTNMKGIHFDNNGFYVTEIPFLQNILKQNFEVIPEEVVKEIISNSEEVIAETVINNNNVIIEEPFIFFDVEEIKPVTKRGRK